MGEHITGQEDIKQLTLQWDIDPEEISRIFEANDGEAMERVIIETNEKLRRVHDAILKILDGYAMYRVISHDQKQAVREVLDPGSGNYDDPNLYY